jgi:Ulp1 family protease
MTMKNQETNENYSFSTSFIDDNYKNYKVKVANVNKQSDVYEGGIFICKFMDYISRNEPITFDHLDINYYRISIGVELIEGKLL